MTLQALHAPIETPTGPGVNIIGSFSPHLRAVNRSPKTQETYLDAVGQCRPSAIMGGVNCVTKPFGFPGLIAREYCVLASSHWLRLVATPLLASDRLVPVLHTSFGGGQKTQNDIIWSP